MITKYKIFEEKNWYKYGLDHTPEVGDYVLISTKDMTNPPNPPFGKILGDALVDGYTLNTHIKVSTAAGDDYIFKSDIIRFLNDDEKYELDKAIKYRKFRLK